MAKKPTKTQSKSPQESNTSSPTNLEEVPTGRKLPVIELFGPTIQGEGYLIGQRSHFLRLGGCSYRCKWCDSMHAVDPKQVKEHAVYMTPADIASAAEKLGDSPWITISGGDPGQHELSALVHNLSHTYRVAVETQGAFWRSWMIACNLVIISPKAPSSGMADKINYDVLVAAKKAWEENPGMGLIFKVVVFDDKDLDWAINLHKEFPKVPFYLSVGTKLGTNEYEEIRWQICDDMEKLFDKTLKKPALSDVTILPQLHALAWGTERGR